MKNCVKLSSKIIFLLILCFVLTTITFSSIIIFDMENADPVTNTWIGGNNQGIQKHQLDNVILKNGKSSLKWEYSLSSSPTGNYPTIELSIPIDKQSWQGCTKVGMWLYFDLITPKTYWTIQPVLCHPSPDKITELGNWDVGENGVTNNSWIYHEWKIPPDIDVSKVTHLRLYYHAGDGWNEVAKSNKVTIFIDDISVSKENNVGTEQRSVPINYEKLFFLGSARNKKTDKAIFTLNNSTFYPITYEVGYGNVSPQLIEDIRRLGCNSIMISMDAMDAGSEELKKALLLCYEKKMPTFISIGEWEYWNFLRKNISLNMIMYNGEPVKHFPDYANPEAKKAHLDRYKKAAEFLKDYANRPVIGICVGAYDSYHLPDGEIHVDFKVPDSGMKYGTNLPYGKWAQKEFVDFLKKSNVSAEAIGISSLDKITSLPHTPETSTNLEAWRQWILFRRYLTKRWLSDTLDVIRKTTGLPATVSFDINFTLQERFATPPFYWSDIVDFVIVYYYGRTNPSEYIPPLLRTVYYPFNDAGKPMISLLEFSSALAGKTPGDEYAKLSAPFVSGLLVTGPVQHLQHTQERVESFYKWINENIDKLNQIKPEPTNILILIDKEAIYFENPFAPVLSNLNIPYDVKYVSNQDPEINLGTYSNILIPQNFSSKLFLKLPKSYNIIVEGKTDNWLGKLKIENTIKFNPDSWAIGELLFQDDFNEMDNNKWAINLTNNSWHIENGNLKINKKDQNVKGFASKTIFESPIMLEIKISFSESGNPRISLLDSNGYIISQSGEEPNEATNELSFGVNPINKETGELGIFVGEWVKLTDIKLGEYYILKLFLASYNTNKDVVYLSLNKENKKAEIEVIGKYTYLIPKRKTDRLWLMWAYDNASASVDYIKINKISKK